MSPRPRVEEQRREQILSAAWQVILDKGHAGVRVADIARRSGTSSASVHGLGLQVVSASPAVSAGRMRTLIARFLEAELFV